MLKPFPLRASPPYSHFSLHYLFIDFKREQFSKLDGTAPSAVGLAEEVSLGFGGEPKWGHCSIWACKERAKGQMGLSPALF